MARFYRSMFAIAALGIIPLWAQETNSGFSVSGSFISGLDSVKEFTGKRNGFALEGAYDLQGAIPVRFGLGVSKFGDGTRNYTFYGVDANDNYYSFQVPGPGIGLTTYQASASLRTTPFQNLNFYVGLTLNKHRLSGDVIPDSDKSVKGLKFGARLDLEYQISRRFAATLAFQVMEMGVGETGNSSNPDGEINAVNPSWLQAGVRYRF